VINVVVEEHVFQEFAKVKVVVLRNFNVLKRKRWILKVKASASLISSAKECENVRDQRDDVRGKAAVQMRTSVRYGRAKMVRARILWNAEGSDVVKLAIVPAKVSAADPDALIESKIAGCICLYMILYYFDVVCILHFF